MSPTRIKEVPDKCLIFLIGPPGVGKSTFYAQVVPNSPTLDRSVIFVTTEQGTTEIIGCLEGRCMAETPSRMMSSSPLLETSMSEISSASRLETPATSGR
jgi:predicted ATP-dependent serine protease